MPVSSEVWGLNLNGWGFVLRWLDDMKQQPAEVKWVVGSDAEHAVYMEFGADHHPPYPFLYPAARDVMNTQADYIISTSDSNEEAMKRIAEAVEKQAKRNVVASAGNRSPGTDPDHPQIRTGELYDSIEAERIS